MRDSFVMYTANIDQISLLNMEQRGNLFTAIMLYAADKELPQMDGMTQMAFSFIKAQLDRDNQKYQKMVESRREAGKLGGRPKGCASSDKQEEAKKANGFFKKQTEAKKHDNDNVYDNDNVNDNNKKTFTPPSVSDVSDYCTLNGYGIDPESFVDFYASKGWMVGKNKMKDWKASVRTWVRSQRQESTAKGSKNQFHNFDQRDMDYDALMLKQVKDWVAEEANEGNT